MIRFNDTLLFDENIPSKELPGFQVVLPEHSYLRYQREAKKLTQQAVADAAGINLRQYQRLESGERSMASTSLRIGLAVWGLTLTAFLSCLPASDPLINSNMGRPAKRGGPCCSVSSYRSAAAANAGIQASFSCFLWM